MSGPARRDAGRNDDYMVIVIGSIVAAFNGERLVLAHAGAGREKS